MRKPRAIVAGISILALAFTLLSATPSQALTSTGCSVTVTNNLGVTLVSSGGYCYLTFSATGANSFVVPSRITSSEVLVVAGGGGGGGGAWGGGGGAGGILYSSNYPLTANSTFNLSVGSGGAGGGASLTPASNRASNGTDSWINSSSTFLAKGGGGGAGYAYGSSTTSDANGYGGGSGGGGTEHGSGGSGGTSTQTLPTNATTKFGNLGGNSTAGSGYVAGAGGGGAGGAGGAMTTSGVGGSGGAGTNQFASWFTAIGQYGVNGYIGGGGGGGSGTTAGASGAGGGGVGGGNTSYPGGNATANTGGGGGGAGYGGQARSGGIGADGLIIFRFLADPPATIATNASLNVYETTTAITTLTANETVTWSIVGGVDSPTITLTGAILAFTALRDFEAPIDNGLNNTYQITVRATDSSGSTSDLAITITILNVYELSTISISPISSYIYKGVSFSIVVTANTPGKVRFYMDGKRIAKCLSVATSGSYPSVSATCAWLPTVGNKHFISATLTPNDNSFSTSDSTKVEVFVRKRTTRR